MQGSSIITHTGSSQANIQNPQVVGTQPLIPAMANLQPGNDSSGNLNISSTTGGIPLSSVTSFSRPKQPVAQPKSNSSITPYLIGLGSFIIILAVIGLVISNIVSNRRLAID
jgi:hypothetical protein